MKQKTEFSTISDRVKRGTLFGLTYASFIPFYMALPADSAGTFITRFAVLSALWFVGHAPPVRKKLSALFNETSPCTQKDILDDVEDLREKAEIPTKVGTYFFHDDPSNNNASTNGFTINIGNGLRDKLTREELKFVIAHEMAHIKTKDHNTFTFSTPAILNSALDSIITSMTMPLLCPIPFASLLFQFGLFLALSRHQEYRADRNAINLTKDFKNAAKSHAKFTPDCFAKSSKLERAISTHPFGLDRLQAMERATYGTIETPCADLAAKLAEEDGKNPSFFRSSPESLIEKAYQATYGKKQAPAAL